jgi:hypothetical protein
MRRGLLQSPTLLHLATVVDQGLKRHELDAKTAFLHVVLDEIVEMEQAKGYHDGSDRACWLHMAIYGLKQAPRA